MIFKKTQLNEAFSDVIAYTAQVTQFAHLRGTVLRNKSRKNSGKRACRFISTRDPRFQIK